MIMFMLHVLSIVPEACNFLSASFLPLVFIQRFLFFRVDINSTQLKFSLFVKVAEIKSRRSLSFGRLSFFSFPGFFFINVTINKAKV